MNSESKTVQGLITQPYGDSLPTATACNASDTAPRAKTPQPALEKIITCKHNPLPTYRTSCGETGTIYPSR